MIYLDNAATTKVRKEVVDKMLPYFDNQYANPSSLHYFGQQAKDELEEAREKIAELLGAKREEIYFTSGGSESNNQAIFSAVKMGKIRNKKHIITSKIEHHSVLNTIKNFEQEGFKVTYLNVDENGIVKLEDLKRAISDDTCLVAIMFANNEIGIIQPIEEIGKICREKGVTFFTDAVQAVGHVNIDVEKLNIDMLSMSAHKFHGPKGVGALYVRKTIPVFSYITGGAQERNRRAGTENLAGIIGMSEALKISIENLEKASSFECKLRDRLIDELTKIPHCILNGSKSQRLSNNINICFEGIEGESLLLFLADEGICASSGSACTSGSLDPSHVLLAIGRPHEVAHGSLRLTLSEFNTEEEIDEVLEKVQKVIKKLRDMSPVWQELEKGERKHVI